MDTETKQNIPVTTGRKSSESALSTLPLITDMERAFEQTFDRLFGRSWPSLSRWTDLPVMNRWFNEVDVRMPSLDVVDRDNEVMVRAEIPGIDKKDIDISLTGDVLTIKGCSSCEKKQDEGDYHRREISSSSYARAVPLPAAVDAAKTNAVLKDGILEITLPKLEPSKRRSIKVQ